MRLLVIVDHPITGSEYVPNWADNMATVNAGPHQVNTVFAGDIVERIKKAPKAFRGLRFDQIMVPKSIQQVDEVYQVVKEVVTSMTAGFYDRVIEYEDPH